MLNRRNLFKGAAALAISVTAFVRPATSARMQIDLSSLIDCRGPFIVDLPIDQANVDRLLLQLVDMPSMVNSRIEIAGDAEPPSWVGRRIVAILRGRGCTVTVN